jgi:BCCT family betaine/carnitine transporter
MSDPNEQGIPAPEGPANLIETEYEVGQDNVEVSVGPFGLDIHNPVFAISGLTIVAFVFITLAFQESAGAAFGDLRDWLTGTFDWFFLTAANIFVLFCLFLIVSPYGKVRLGGKDATPDYSYTGWFAMLFAAGMGIGLMFFGVSEPISHFSPSVAERSRENGAVTLGTPGWAAGRCNIAEARLGMAATIFHWALHPWAIYAVVALALALFSYNKGLPLTMRSAFYPIFWVNGSGAGGATSSTSSPCSPRCSALPRPLASAPSRQWPVSTTSSEHQPVSMSPRCC